MSATLSISLFSNFLIITNILHNYILYAFLFYPFYHKLTINHQFFDIFSFPLLQNSIWAFRYIEGYTYRNWSCFRQNLPDQHPVSYCSKLSSQSSKLFLEMRYFPPSNWIHRNSFFLKLGKEKEHMELNPYTLWLLKLYFIFNSTNWNFSLFHLRSNKQHHCHKKIYTIQ